MSRTPEHLLRVARAVSDDVELPTLAEMNARTEILRSEADPLVRIQRIGASGDGEPIDLISVGHGSRSALVVGTPHPNEPIGCLTIEFLIERLRRDPGLREELDVTWHFIKTIEPDGLRLNEGWLHRPFDATTYLRNFYRPAAREQAEYSFPMAIESYRFSASTPENQAWQEAIRITQPNLLYSLHNCEYGGAFYLLSRNEPALAEVLSGQPALFEVPVETLGESHGSEARFAAGVFAAFDPETVLGQNQSLGPIYTAGASSFGYCRTRGTLGLIAETPHWRPSRIHSGLDPRSAVAGARGAVKQLAGDVVRLLDRHLPGLAAVEWPYAARFNASLTEMREHAVHAGAADHAWPDMISADDVSRRHHATLFNLLRPVGMLLRVASAARAAHPDDHWAVSAVEAAERLLTGALRQYGLLDGMEPIPLKQSVGIQVLAGLQAASMLRNLS